ncbi:MAG TPA: SRPBCC domain-containing protein [Acidimicrobiia bacterium]|nr:SRPBCC domain-containing protein [Acidimicrobiia bacterium]
MGDYTIQARFDAACSPEEIMKWLTTTEGIAGWWSDTVRGSAGSPGDEFHVSFPTTDVVFDLTVAEAHDGVVSWDVLESPPWWKGTSIRFQVEPVEEGSSLLFNHAGFEPDDPIIAVITPAWVGFLNNLVEVAQTGVANPAVMN